jgi:hypothetical protein
MVNPSMLNRIKTISKDYKRQYLPEDEASSNIISSISITASTSTSSGPEPQIPIDQPYPVMISMRDTISPPDQPRYDSLMNQHRDGNTMTSYDLINGTIHIRIVRSKTLEVLAEDTFADSDLAKQFVTELSGAANKVRKSRMNVTERGTNGTPEPEEQIVI